MTSIPPMAGCFFCSSHWYIFCLTIAKCKYLRVNNVNETIGIIRMHSVRLFRLQQYFRFCERLLGKVFNSDGEK